ncbi:hypothetical protein Q3G72_032727 [Acer saccharum]|nr:hypothetical protein Q3G72_032727 [Acer saccharum]
MSSKGSTPTAIHLAILLAIFLTGHVVVSDDTTPISAMPPCSWPYNVQAPGSRKRTPGPRIRWRPRLILLSLREARRTYDFKKINDAIKSIPQWNTKRVRLYGSGCPRISSKIKIERTKPFITFYGSPNAMPTITQYGTALQYGTMDSATVIVESDYFVAANIIFKNSAPRPDSTKNGGQALALRISGTKAAFYKCKMLGFQDTLCDDKGVHFFKDCYIEGTVDFIFGRGKSIYLNTQLHVLGDKDITVITAQARDSLAEDVGYSFVHCQITGTGKRTYLGRAWMPYPRVIFAYTSMTDVVLPVAWDEERKHSERCATVYFAEYKCNGAGANMIGRAKFTKKLTDAQVRPFLTLGYIQGSKWLLPPPSL